jgi:hypothetical protein
MHRSSEGNSLAFEHAEHPANLPFGSMAQDGTGRGKMGGGGDPPKLLHICRLKNCGTMSLFLMKSKPFLLSFLQIVNPGRKLLTFVH